MQVVRSWVRVLSGVVLAMAAFVAASAQPAPAPLTVAPATAAPPHALSGARAVNAEDAADNVPGLVLLIKGQKADEELAEAAEALHLLKAVHTSTIDTPTGRVVVIEKRSATPRMYPRRDGEPARVPLGRKK